VLRFLLIPLFSTWAHIWVPWGVGSASLVLLLLDFEKAFDRIEWDFLFKALDKLGFSPTWVRWVASLYRDATSAIKVNGVAGPDFQLARSVRQGCPLAPYLFILTIDVLGYMLADPNHGVEGLSLPRGGLIRDQTLLMTQPSTWRAPQSTWTGRKRSSRPFAARPKPKSIGTNRLPSGPAKEKSDAFPSPGLNPLEGSTRCNCGKLRLEGRSRLLALKRGRGAC